MSNASSYGRFYWCVKTNLSDSGEIYIHADSVELTADGSLVFWQHKESEDPFGELSQRVNLSIAAGNWKACFAASVIDGHAVAVEHWA